MCDFCGVGTLIRSPVCVTDKKCNFDICMACYSKLPEEDQLVPSKLAPDCINHLKKQEAFQEDVYLHLMENVEGAIA